MSSIIEGYNYDIFISYRQKDNKGDRWVSEFVEALKTELESTFKEEISVYFDINPHDGLLETHDVHDSLKEKLKCLVFIPIISRTYCDPKSFAWENEFKEFIKLASEDLFGLKIKLPGGNVVNRVLPIQIHELDNRDKFLIEQVLGGFIRGIEFIYKEPGVNRPLTLRDDERNNFNNTIYRNQINKVALALNEILSGLNADSSNNEVIPSTPKIKLDITRDSEIYEKSNRKLKIDSNSIWRIFSKLVTLSLAFGTILFFSLWISGRMKRLPIYNFSSTLPFGSFRMDGLGSSIAISPDGRKVVYVLVNNDTSCLYLKLIDETESSLIPGTEGASSPFFSHDGKWLGFFSNGFLKKILPSGGSPEVLCEARSGMGGTWRDDDTIIYSDSFNAGLMKVSATGGKPIQITNALNFKIGEEEHSHFWPQLLPGSKTILYTIWHGWKDMRIAGYSAKEGIRQTLIDPGCYAKYIKKGFLIYAWNGDMLAVPFDPKRWKVKGPPETVIRGIQMNNIGLAHYSISDNGTLVYIPGNFMITQNILVFSDIQGNLSPLKIAASQAPRFSPDGKQILYILEGLRIYEFARGISRKFTEQEFDTYWAIWSPDGKQIIYNSSYGGSSFVNLFIKQADGSGVPRPLVINNFHHQPKCWVNNGKTLIYTEGIHPDTGMDIYLVNMEGDTIPKPFFNSRFNEMHPAISADGKWLAYASDISGREEVFVCSFPEKEYTTQVSVDGGLEPVWSPNMDRIYFRDKSGDNVMSADIKTEPGLEVQEPVLMFSGKFYPSSGVWGTNYDISPDGTRFALLKEGMNPGLINEYRVIINFPEYIEKIFKNKN